MRDLYLFRLKQIEELTEKKDAKLHELTKKILQRNEGGVLTRLLTFFAIKTMWLVERMVII